MSTIVARFTFEERAAQSALLRTAAAKGAATYTAQYDKATATFVVVEHQANSNPNQN